MPDPNASPSSPADFFVGYATTAPTHGRWLRRLVLVLLVAAPALAAAISLFQKPLPSGTFEFGVKRIFEGVIYENPVPILHIVESSHDPDTPAARNLLLVGAGKFGLPDFAEGCDGRKVRFAGTLIYRERMTMVEMNDEASFEVLGTPETSEERERFEKLGAVTLEGEIVDTKCFFGVMRPATGKVHRACAIRCLSGGVPPGLLVQNTQGDGVVFMLAGPPGETLDLDVQWAARTVRARGQLEIHDDVPVLRVASLELTD